MGVIERVLGVVFGGGRSVVQDTVELFRENAESGARRAATVQGQAMAQLGAEFLTSHKGAFDRFIDGVNRLPRPALALGTLGLFVSAMVDPIWFAARMQGVALVPESLWWLLGVIVSFYFGARHQLKAQGFQREIAATVARVPQVVENIRALNTVRADSPGVADTGPDAALSLSVVKAGSNPALDDWKAIKGR